MHAAAATSASASAARPAAPLPLASVADLPRRYAAILLDQFGCLHDGREALPGAVAAVAALAATGARLVVLSNSSRRAGGALAKLGRLGFDPACFAGAVTSGEVAHATLAAQPRAYGSRCLHITWAARGGVSLEGLGLTVCGEREAASVDFILVHGTEGVGAPGEGDDPARPGPAPRSLDQLKTLLETAAAASPAPPPLLCANPDLVTVDGGSLLVMPGTLASWYEAAGGPVVRLGKPAPPIYAAALAALGGGIAPGDVLAVGDSLDHDVAGAAAAGMDSLFIGGGIDGARLGLPSGAGEAAAYLAGRRGERSAGSPTVDPAHLAALLAGRLPGQVPTYAMDYLVA